MSEVGVVRVIGRLNVGGPAIQAITLTKLLEDRGYRTTLVRGVEGDREGNMDDLVRELGVKPRLLASMRRELGPHDVAAVLGLARILRAERPQILHTHAAKGGTVGRLAARLARESRPAVSVHTFHGHVLSGYFSRRRAALYRQIERRLAAHTSQLIAVSDEVRDDLVALGVAAPDRIEVVPLGFDLAPFRAPESVQRTLSAALREELGIPPSVVLVTLVARLVPIKRVDRFLSIAAALARRTSCHFLIVGDGELAEELRTNTDAVALGHRLTWAGLRRDMPAVMAASDIVCLTSDNEGTPVSLIEAQASERPVVSTAVGGVGSAVSHGGSGYLVPAEEHEAFVRQLERLVSDPELRSGLGASGREFVAGRFAIDRLVDDIDDLYCRLLSAA